MMSEKIPMEEVNKILFPEQFEKSKGETQEEVNSSKPEPNLLKQRNLSGELNLEKVPYYKRPTVQIAFVILVGFPIIWLFWAAFDVKPQAAENPAPPNPYLKENEQLKASLEEMRQQIDEMNLQKSLASQQQDIPIVEPGKTDEPETQPEPTPAVQPKPVRVVAQPPRPIPQPRVVYRQPLTRPVAQTKVEPEIDPMEQWLAQADRGYSVTSFNKPHSNSVLASVPPPVIRSQTYPIPTEPVTQSSDPPPEIVTHHPSPRPRTQASLLDESRLAVIRDEPSLFNDEQLQDRLNRGETILAKRTRYVSTNTEEEPTNTTVSEALAFQNNITRVDTNRLLDIGAKAKATLVEGIAWAQQSFNSDRKYILYLEEGFKNTGGIEVLPSGTRLIAEIDLVSSSGLFTMKVTHIVKSFDEPKIPVPPGTLDIIAKDGSPLQAKLKQKGNSDFLSDLGTVIAPGVEKALDSTGNLLVNDGDGVTVFRTNRNDDPLANGASGVARGVSNLFRDRVRSNRSTISYFEFKGDQTVRVVVNEDFYLGSY